MFVALECRACLMCIKQWDTKITNLSHDLWVWFSYRVSPLHSDRVPPHFDLAAHQATASLCRGLVVLILEETETTVLFLVIRLMIQYHLLETLCEVNNHF